MTDPRSPLPPSEMTTLNKVQNATDSTELVTYGIRKCRDSHWHVTIGGLDDLATKPDKLTYERAQEIANRLNAGEALDDIEASLPAAAPPSLDALKSTEKSEELGVDQEGSTASSRANTFGLAPHEIIRALAIAENPIAAPITLDTVCLLSLALRALESERQFWIGRARELVVDPSRFIPKTNLDGLDAR